MNGIVNVYRVVGIDLVRLFYFILISLCSIRLVMNSRVGVVV